MRASLIFALAAGATALDHVDPGFHVGHIEARQTRSIRPEVDSCISALQSLLVSGAPTPPPELMSFSSSKRAALTGPVTDFCQIFSSIPADLTSAVSVFEKSMDSFNSWIQTEVTKIPTSVCPVPPVTSSVIASTRVACTSGERRRIPGGFPTSTNPAQADCNSIASSVFLQRPSPPPEFTSYYAQLAATRTYTDACEQLRQTYPPPIDALASAYTSSLNAWSTWLTSELTKHTSLCPTIMPTPTPGSLEDDCAKGIPRPINRNTTTGPSTTGSPTGAPNATSGGAGGSPPVPTTAQPAAAASNVVAVGFAAVAFIGAAVAL